MKKLLLFLFSFFAFSAYSFVGNDNNVNNSEFDLSTINLSGLTRVDREDGSFVLTGTVNGDYVTFNLRYTYGTNVTGNFKNHTMAVTWSVSGTLTSQVMNVHTNRKSNNWKFVGYWKYGSYVGTASSGRVTYYMEVN